MYNLLNILQVPLNIVYLLYKTTIFMHETIASNGSFRKNVVTGEATNLEVLSDGSTIISKSSPHW